MIVVDTNIITYFYLNSEFSELAEKLYQKEPNWAVPLLWRSEFRNVLAFYIKRKVISLNDGIQIFELAETLFDENEYEINSAQVLNLAHRSGCSAYDCEFVSLAKNLNVFLVTMDKKVLNSFPNIALSLRKYKKTSEQ